ncbi:hypothetical protein AX15_007346 [Amanita polypyramis BW_CC]|nr:hypothetical protein AX15_007346 [Amanita polypyramis BW_CC]
MFKALVKMIPGSASTLPRTRTRTTEEQSLLDAPSPTRGSHRFEKLSDFNVAHIDKYAAYIDDPPGPTVRKPAPDTVMKTLPSHMAHEAFIMTYVAENTSIPVPRVGRVHLQHGHTYILVEHIDGVDLAATWPHLSLWRKVRIAWTVRGYVKQLRRLRLPYPDTPGPSDGTGMLFRCKGHFFTSNGAGPFPTHHDLCEWFRKKRRIAKVAQMRHGLELSETEFVDSDPLVLVNGNINPRHIRIGKDGTVWLVDWSLAGLYPKSFEYCSIMADAQLPDSPKLWARLAPWIANGRSNKQQWQFMRSIKLALLFSYDESDFLW